MTSLVRFSIDASLFIQILTLLLNLFAFFVPIDRWDFALKEILGLETAVQIVELAFYTWYRGHLVGNGVDVSEFRYYDWFLTTPTMLFSTASYYGYINAKEEENNKEPFSIVSFFRENSQTLLLMMALNAIMLIVGYLQETGKISLFWSTLLGYAALLGSFRVLYGFASKVPNQQWLFQFMFIVWSLYGVAALLPSTQKNISYNILDIFAKNFYGLFLGYTIYRRKI